MSKTNAFKFEKELERKISRDISKILESSGFDSEDSLLSIDSKVIANIENYSNDNLIDVLIGASYENMKCFKLKPGHTIFLQNLFKNVKLRKREESNENKKCTKTGIFAELLMHLANIHWNGTIKCWETYIYQNVINRENI